MYHFIYLYKGHPKNNNTIFRYDEVRIIFKEDNTTNQIVSYSGHKLPSHKHSHSSNVTVNFTSDGNTHGKGFRISISFDRKGI